MNNKVAFSQIDDGKIRKSLNQTSGTTLKTQESINLNENSIS